jgi:hypothetical protein
VGTVPLSIGHGCCEGVVEIALRAAVVAVLVGGGL